MFWLAVLSHTKTLRINEIFDKSIPKWAARCTCTPGKDYSISRGGCFVDD
jgi:hypothetical protein